MKFLRTSSTRRLLGTLVALVAAIAAGTAIAVAATAGGPVPQSQSLAGAVHQALSAPAVKGVTADIKFTNNLIDSADFTSDNVDPILQGASGRLWLSDHQMRVELQSSNGDAQVLVNGHSFWISDPTSNTVYEGTLPADHSAAKPNSSAKHGVPTIADIQSEITKLLQSVNLSGAQVGSSAPTPSDIAGRPAYTVSVSPRHDGGLLGSAQLAWDALQGTPLSIGIYARNNSTPVLALQATSISYGNVPAADFAISPPAGSKVVKVSTAGASRSTSHRLGHARHAKAAVTGEAAVARSLPFTLRAPTAIAGLPRRDVKLLDWGGKQAALVTYGQNLGGVAVIEQGADQAGAKAPAKSVSPTVGGLSMPTVSINGATGTELSTALGTVIHFSTGAVNYTVIGSVPAAAAEIAARGLTAATP
ncbi:MAG: LolA family protein [Solirubrobacteraceae bacterium]